MTTWCFYHKVDFDGHCSAALVKLVFPSVKLVGSNYGDILPLDEIHEDDIVFIVDFSFPAEQMYKLSSKCKEVVWIDHHQTAIQDMSSYGNPSEHFKGLWQEGSLAGCELTWKYLFGDEELPRYVELLGRYDVWDHSGNDVLPFQYGMRLYDTNVETDFPFWTKLHNGGTFYAQILTAGQTILKYETQQNKRICKGSSYEIDFQGYRALVVNRGYLSSLFFESQYDPEKHDIFIYWYVTRDQILISLRTPKPDIDVSVIAKWFGGGGHPAAAGFKVPLGTDISFLQSGNPRVTPFPLMGCEVINSSL